MKKEIISALGSSHPWADTIHWFDTIDSTNDRAKAMADAGAAHGTVLIADRQSAGRGRMGRSFHSPGGAGIYLSVILRPDCPPAELMHLTCAVGTAMCNAVEEVTGLRPGIKWINDLVIYKKKLGGILTELSLTATGGVRYAVVGIGLNCTQGYNDLPPEIRDMAISLQTATGKSVSRSTLAAAMIRALEMMDRQLLESKQQIMDRYRRDCITLGQDVSVVHNGSTRLGKALDIDNDGALLIKFSDGELAHIQSGELSVRGLYGYC